jgi:hypothetical protein
MNGSRSCLRHLAITVLTGRKAPNYGAGSYNSHGPYFTLGDEWLARRWAREGISSYEVNFGFNQRRLVILARHGKR